jgi:glutamate 5-kinase
MLVTHEDFEDANRREHIKNTLERLLQCETVVPVFNENDSVAIEEIRFGDNDRLSCSVALLARADLLILLTSVDGLLDPETKTLIPEVNDAVAVLGLANGEKGKYSTGGMASKLQAVAQAVQGGVATIIANGLNPENISALVAGQGIGTRFRLPPQAQD